MGSDYLGIKFTLVNCCDSDLSAVGHIICLLTQINFDIFTILVLNNTANSSFQVIDIGHKLHFVLFVV